VNRPDYAREARYACADPVKLVVALGLEKGAQRQSKGMLVNCPVHAERSPSCSVTKGRDGTVQVRCFGCEFAGDALSLIAVRLGLSLRDRDSFREVLAEAAKIGGHLSLEAEIRGGTPAPDRKPLPRPELPPERDYPPIADILDVWARGGACTDDREICGYLVFRRIDPEQVAARRLCRVIPDPVPRWASYRRRSWHETGHRLIARAFDPTGRPRSVRAMRVRDGDSPKRLPPGGFKASELALLNESAHCMLRGKAQPGRVIIVEGEPDWLTWSTRTEEPVVGILTGTWSERFAAGIPRGATVTIRTHADDAGDRYAQAVIDTLNGRCNLRRSEPEAA
jgi:hypothetical protein